MNYKVNAHIHSLNGDIDEVIVIKETVNGYIVNYHGIKCTAIFNHFTCQYYVDYLYGIIKE